jgi:hypothetical protein
MSRPDLKPFVERSIRTLKYECLWQKHPENPSHAQAILTEYRHFYNHERAHQGSACRNQPPFTAFPTLPILPSVPSEVDPDKWLSHYHGKVFRRRLSAKGSTTVDEQSYYVGSSYAGKLVRFHLDANKRCFQIVSDGKSVKEVDIEGLYGQRLSITQYIERMMLEARSQERRLAMA